MAEETLLTTGSTPEASDAKATESAGEGAAPETATSEAPATNPKPEAPADTNADADKTEAKQEGAPEAYEYKLPDGFELNDEAKGSFDALAREFGLSNENAQKLVDLHATAMQKAHEGFVEQVAAQREKWHTETKSDKEIGGNNLSEVSKNVQSVVSKFGTAELKNALNETGIGNHPEMIRFVNRIAKELKLQEGAFVAGGNPTSVELPTSKVLFGGGQK